MDNKKELCPKCLGAKEVVLRKNRRFKTEQCSYCELDENGKPSGEITEVYFDDDIEYD